jgi:uncharacterized membrane protein YkvA (DUF1232 family)
VEEPGRLVPGMSLPIGRIRSLIFEVPARAKLAYCLLRDPRVPLAPKLAVLGALGVIVSPIDLPGWLPLVGQMDLLALSLLAVKVFVDACPEDLVREHRDALDHGQSLFDQDLRRAGEGAMHLWAGIRSGGAETPRQLEEPK